MKRNRPTKKNRKKEKKEQRKNCNMLDGKKKKEKKTRTDQQQKEKSKKETVSKLLVQITLSLCQLVFGFVKKEFKLITIVKALVLMTRAFLEG